MKRSRCVRFENLCAYFIHISVRSFIPSGAPKSHQWSGPRGAPEATLWRQRHQQSLRPQLQYASIDVRFPRVNFTPTICCRRSIESIVYIALRPCSREAMECGGRLRNVALLAAQD